MRIRHLAPLAAGFVVAAGVTTFPASAADQSVAAQSMGNTWSQTAPTINVGETVTWSTDGGNAHNVCVAKPGDTPSPGSAASCTEFRNGDIATSWSGNATNAHTFTTAGTYQFICQAHPVSMTGTVTVLAAPGTTTTTTGTGTTPTQTQPTPTGTDTQPAAAPTPTQPITAPADTTAPNFVGKLKRHSSRKALIVEVGSSEAGTLKATVWRRAPRSHKYSRVGQASVKVNQGKNVVKLPRKAAGSLRSGSYRVTLQLVDAAGNSSKTKTLTFKLG